MAFWDLVVQTSRKKAMRSAGTISLRPKRGGTLRGPSPAFSHRVGACAPVVRPQVQRRNVKAHLQEKAWLQRSIEMYAERAQYLNDQRARGARW